ncbi:MAG: NAD(P)-binding domain-containing protein [Patescibacteria group bacterium]|nr:NAD(P)-binding domain-containing protein [Patescibacteria group bacterium]
MKIAFFEINEQEKKDYFSQNLTGHEVGFFEQALGENFVPNHTDFEVISIFVGSKINQTVIDAFPNLKAIVVRATGFDNVDLAYTKSKNILVCNVPAYGSNTVAEFTFGLILSLSRKIPQASYRLKVSEEFSFEGLRGFDLNGKTLGVIGTGKIGSNVIKIAKGFNMAVLAYDPHQNEELTKTLSFNYVTLEELLKNSDIVTIHVPLMEQTHHLINKDNLPLMKKGSLLINTSRGGIVDTDALSKALMQEQLGGAALDVLEEEGDLKEEIELLVADKIPLEDYKKVIEDHVLIHLPNVIITPHMAFYTKEAEFSIMETTVKNIKSALADTPENVV